jgi:glycosyltransferase involved in cell wall biosynthesis
VRIALDATYSVDQHPSGIATYSRELLSGLAKTFPEDTFLHCYRLKQFKEAPSRAFRNVKRCMLQPPLTTFRADLFHALNQRVDRRLAKKVVSTFHDLFVMTGEYSTPEFRARFTKQAQRAAQNSDFIITVSEFTANQVSSLLGFHRSRICVVPHGVHQPVCGAAVQRENIILFVGALQLRKNIVRLVQAFETLPENWRLVLAGAPTGYQAETILARIEQSPRRDHIQLTGYVTQSELERLYSCASIFAFPSLDEGFGMPIVEAMAHGVPVITSRRSAMAEVAGNAAMLIDPDQTEELRFALNLLVHNREQRQRLSEAGRARSRLYTWEKAVRSTHSVYNELLRGRQ